MTISKGKTMFQRLAHFILAIWRDRRGSVAVTRRNDRRLVLVPMFPPLGNPFDYVIKDIITYIRLLGTRQDPEAAWLENWSC